MTKDDLARAVVGLPGFVWGDGALDGYSGLRAECNEFGAPDEDSERWPVLDDAATGGVLVAMVPPEHRGRVIIDHSGLYFVVFAKMSVPCDSLGHAAAMVLVDCGRCHVGS